MPRDGLLELHPDDDEVFSARKGYYRNDAAAVLTGRQTNAVALVAAEHTAQLKRRQRGTRSFRELSAMNFSFRTLILALMVAGQTQL